MDQVVSNNRKTMLTLGADLVKMDRKLVEENRPQQCINRIEEHIAVAREKYDEFRSMEIPGIKFGNGVVRKLKMETFEDRKYTQKVTKIKNFLF